MSDSFDPYHVWLAIPAKYQPPDHYRLLGLEKFESDREVIDTAADSRMTHLKTFQHSARGALAEQILNEVATARICLLNAEKKPAYDAQLRGPEIRGAEPRAQSAPAPPASSEILPVAPPKSLTDSQSVPPPAATDTPLRTTYSRRSARDKFRSAPDQADVTSSRQKILILAGGGGMLVLLAVGVALALTLRGGAETPPAEHLANPSKTPAKTDSQADPKTEAKTVSKTDAANKTGTLAKKTDEKKTPPKKDDPEQLAKTDEDDSPVEPLDLKLPPSNKGDPKDPPAKIEPPQPVGPFAGAPPTVKLPPATDASSTLLAKFSAPVDAPLEATLLGGTLRNKGLLKFVLAKTKANDGQQAWAIGAQKPDEVKPKIVARVSRREDGIHFYWHPNAKTVPDVGYVKNCLLLFKSADHEHAVALRKPVRVAPLLVSFKPRGSRSAPRIDLLPDEKLVAGRITSLEGPVVPFGRFREKPFALKGKEVSVELAGPPALSLKVTPSFRSGIALHTVPYVTFDGAQPAVINKTALTRQMATAQQLKQRYKSVLAKLRAESKKRKMKKPTAVEIQTAAQLELATRAVWQIKQLAASLKTHDEQTTIHYRLTYQADGWQVELARSYDDDSSSAPKRIEEGSISPGPLAGRIDPKRRAVMLAAAGGDAESEKAVDAALQWIVRHQLADGGWNFDHRGARGCNGRCENPGAKVHARNGATGLALMALLGSGHASRKSKYFTNVKAGLQYLARHGGPTGSYRDKEGRMYSHGIVAIALCEAYALTREKTLREPAQRAINYIAYAQDPKGGGWRYKVHEAGDTSSSGWQLAAFQAAHAAGLSVPTATASKFSRFLNTVQTGGGARYLYKSGGSNNNLGNIGFYCRIHLGWKKDHPSLIKGAKIITSKGPAKGPAKGSFYHNYYSTQLLYHLGGDDWKKWNEKLRPLLVTQQATAGHAAGSWYSGGGESIANHGGRLYCTVMAALTLQTPYRYERLYQ